MTDSPRLTRSATDRRLAGVSGGLAEFFGLNAMLVRAAFVVLAFFGVGLAAYVVLAVVMPGQEPLAGAAKFMLGVLALAALITFPYAGISAVVLLVPAALGVLAWRALGGRVDPRVVRASGMVVGVSAAVALGLAAGIATAFGSGVVVAAIVIAVGVALIVGGLLGGARWLVVPALLLVLPASVVSAADLRLRGGVGERVYRPVTAADVAPVYRLGAGHLRIDLRDTHFTPGAVVPLKVRLGVGELEMLVPRGVCVDTTGHLGAGDSRLFSEENQGADVDVEQHLHARAAAPEVRLDARVGAGLLYVDTEPDRFHDRGFAPPAGCAPR